MFYERDHEGAMLKYEKALKLLPRNYIDVSYLRSNMPAFYMQMGLSEYSRAIHECNLADKKKKKQREWNPPLEPTFSLALCSTFAPISSRRLA